MNLADVRPGLLLRVISTHLSRRSSLSKRTETEHFRGPDGLNIKVLSDYCAQPDEIMLNKAMARNPLVLLDQQLQSLAKEEDDAIRKRNRARG
jgi:hypothetical protein